MGGRRVLRHPDSRGSLLSCDLSWEGQGWLSTYAAQQTGTARVLGVHCNLSVHLCELLLLRHLHNTKQLEAVTWARYLHSGDRTNTDYGTFQVDVYASTALV